MKFIGGIGLIMALIGCTTKEHFKKVTLNATRENDRVVLAERYDGAEKIISWEDWQSGRATADELLILDNEIFYPGRGPLLGQ